MSRRLSARKPVFFPGVVKHRHDENRQWDDEFFLGPRLVLVGAGKGDGDPCPSRLEYVVAICAAIAI
jgi:hypothetical protein